MTTEEVSVSRPIYAMRVVRYALALGLVLALLAPIAAWGQLLNLPGLITGTPAKETKSDEVALAGKGFTPEVESSYRSKHPEMNFAQVDQIEGFKVDPASLQTFIKEGDLKP
jgi:hypothetical protein